MQAKRTTNNALVSMKRCAVCQIQNAPIDPIKEKRTERNRRTNEIGRQVIYRLVHESDRKDKRIFENTFAEIYSKYSNTKKKYSVNKKNYIFVKVTLYCLGC